MAKQFPSLGEDLQRFIEAQHIFFVGTAGPDGRVNVSPKGMDSLRVLGPNRIVWRNLTGSGNETAGHLCQINRMTLMWCSFDTRPMILRTYGSAQTLHTDDATFAQLNDSFPADIGARQIFDMHIDLVQSSCGYSIPFYDFVSDRDVLERWSEQKGVEGIRTHWATRNRETIDGAPTGIPIHDT